MIIIACITTPIIVLLASATTSTSTSTSTQGSQGGVFLQRLLNQPHELPQELGELVVRVHGVWLSIQHHTPLPHQILLRLCVVDLLRAPLVRALEREHTDSVLVLHEHLHVLPPTRGLQNFLPDGMHYHGVGLGVALVHLQAGVDSALESPE
jgi:hypothetical protein